MHPFCRRYEFHESCVTIPLPEGGTVTVEYPAVKNQSEGILAQIEEARGENND